MRGSGGQGLCPSTPRRTFRLPTPFSQCDCLPSVQGWARVVIGETKATSALLVVLWLGSVRFTESSRPTQVDRTFDGVRGGLSCRGGRDLLLTKVFPS